jgi:RsiW-degrading membrane proteinase PrsW (M82 family)
MRASDLGLKLTEVPIKVSYSTPKPSKHTPLYHAFQVLFGVIKFTSIRHPLIFYGIPGIVMLGVGVIFSFIVMQYYLSKKYFSIPFTLLASIFTIAGLLLMFTAVILFTVISILRRHEEL